MSLIKRNIALLFWFTLCVGVLGRHAFIRCSLVVTESYVISCFVSAASMLQCTYMCFLFAVFTEKCA